MPRASVFTLPNLISTSRFALALGFAGSETVPVRLAIISIASLTDVLDGWLARRAQVTSRFGAMLDPLADRFFVLVVVFTYVAEGHLSIVQAMTIMLRDIMTVIGYIVARSVSWLRNIPFKARKIGKLVTAAQLATFLIVLVAPDYTTAAVWVVGFLGAAATVDYTLMLWHGRARTESL